MAIPRKVATVFGGSGFIGRYVVKRLAAAGYMVRVGTRHTDRALFLKPMGAVGQIVRQAALELAAFNINVNALAPGPCATMIGGGRLQDPANQAGFGAQAPMRRIAVPEDMKGAAIFLSSRASAFITGVHVAIDGGALLGKAD